MKVALFGGSFDPVHCGHLAVAEAARERTPLSRVLFTPAHFPPHKGGRPLADPRHRLAMVALALEGREGFEPCDLEIARGGVSYTVDTVEALRLLLPPGAEIHLLIGSDTLADLPHWKEARKVVASCAVISVHRRGSPRALVASLSGHFAPAEIARIEAGFLEIEPIDVSSSEIRSRRARGLPIEGLVPPAVAEYIERHGLYRAPAASTG